jgi:ABC-type sugar transport system ATPase subunit
MSNPQIVMQAQGLVKRYGQVTALDGADFELRAGEILAVIGDNGAGKSSLIKALSGAVVPDEGEIRLDGQAIHFKSPIEARRAGIETVYQDLAVAPAMTIAENLFLGRELRRPGWLGRVFRMLDKKRMLAESIARMQDLISHNMPHVFEIADRIHVARLGRRAAVLNPKKISMSDTVAVMTGAMRPEDIPAECLAEGLAH